ncbi:DUF4421 family protein [Frigoriflavimonas asaccharolytica]|uniref:DUF4421 domain-containing protein n=1 Tax=Frigoriflavimonas asaccharolytica TaxID=2735899 RepID=A0A8J8KB69_9FLAO|nr:DUF4421 family protein [Frigoriflavimonas asaccharolytica]NRS92254.1 hypothetical protein [Frigoriflavimonas asaccharolytica]
MLILFSCLQNIAGQQKQDSTKISVSDSITNTYKEKLDRYVGLRLDTNTNVSKFSFINRAPLKNIDVVPNQDYQARIAINYKWLTLAFSFSPKIGGLNDNVQEKGKTKITSFDFSFNLKKTQHRLFFTKTKGYYLSNSEIYRAELLNQNIFSRYAKLPDFESIQLGSETFYFYNSDQFSKVFSRDKSEIQLKSAGSFVSFLGLYYSKIDGSEQDLSFLNLFTNKDIPYPNINESYYGAIGKGYAYNYIFEKNFFITALGIPSVGVQYSRLQYPFDAADTNKTELTVSILTEASIGFSDKKWFTGILGNYTGFTSTSKGNKLAGTKGYATLFIGYRFAPPKVVKNTFEYIDGQL